MLWPIYRHEMMNRGIEAVAKCGGVMSGKYTCFVSDRSPPRTLNDREKDHVKRGLTIVDSIS